MFIVKKLLGALCRNVSSTGLKRRSEIPRFFRFSINQSITFYCRH